MSNFKQDKKSDEEDSLKKDKDGLFDFNKKNEESDNDLASLGEESLKNKSLESFACEKSQKN